MGRRAACRKTRHKRAQHGVARSMAKGHMNIALGVKRSGMSLLSIIQKNADRKLEDSMTKNTKSMAILLIVFSRSI
jgi:hypothetical protein